MNSIVLSNVSFTYPKSDFTVGVEELTLEAGKLHIFVGRNGSGKSTILKLCCGILRPTEGKITAFGKDLNQMSLGEIGGHISYLFQEPSKQLFATTVWDEMTFASYFKGEDPKEAKDKAVYLLKKFNLYHLLRRSTYRLSRGEKQRLAIAAILMQDVKLIILDEPTTGIDKENRTILYGVIETLLEEGTGVAIISHDNELINRFNNGKVIKIEEGGLVNV